MKRLYFLVVLLLVSVIIASCSKKDDNPAGPSNTDDQTNNQTTPSIPKLSFKGPATLANNEVVNQIKSYVGGFNSYSQLLSTAFASVQPDNSGNEWKWVLSHANGATEIFTAARSSDGGFTWNVIKNGIIDTSSYNNWKAVDGTTSKDGNSGGWKIYNDNTEVVAAQISWTGNSLTTRGTLLVYENSVLKWKTEVVNNSDKSGSLKYYGEGPTILFDAAWNIDGSGTWKSYVRGIEKVSGKF